MHRLSGFRGVFFFQVLVVLGKFTPLTEGCFDVSQISKACIFRVTVTFTLTRFSHSGDGNRTFLRFVGTETCSSFYNFNHFNNIMILLFVCISCTIKCLILLMHGATIKFIEEWLLSLMERLFSTISTLTMCYFT